MVDLGLCPHLLTARHCGHNRALPHVPFCLVVSVGGPRSNPKWTSCCLQYAWGWTPQQGGTQRFARMRFSLCPCPRLLPLQAIRESAANKYNLQSPPPERGGGPFRRLAFLSRPLGPEANEKSATTRQLALRSSGAEICVARPLHNRRTGPKSRVRDGGSMIDHESHHLDRNRNCQDSDSGWRDLAVRQTSRQKQPPESPQPAKTKVSRKQTRKSNP